MVRFSILSVASVVAVLAASTLPSHADFTVCNKSGEKLSVAIGYKSGKMGWVSEGWWNIDRKKCEDVITGKLESQYYYVYAEGVKDAVWSAPKKQQGGFFCMKNGKFTFRNDDFQKKNEIDCEGNGAKTKQFIEVNTKDHDDFEYSLED